MYSYNTFCSPNLNGFSPYELVFGKKLKVLIDLETVPDIRILGTCNECFEFLAKRLEYL